MRRGGFLRCKDRLCDSNLIETGAVNRKGGFLGRSKRTGFWEEAKEPVGGPQSVEKGGDSDGP